MSLESIRRSTNENLQSVEQCDLSQSTERIISYIVSTHLKPKPKFWNTEFILSDVIVYQRELGARS